MVTRHVSVGTYLLVAVHETKHIMYVTKLRIKRTLNLVRFNIIRDIEQ